MTKQEALEIIKNENLDETNFFSTNRLHFESTVIMEADSSWKVYIYGENESVSSMSSIHKPKVFA